MRSKTRPRAWPIGSAPSAGNNRRPTTASRCSARRRRRSLGSAAAIAGKSCSKEKKKRALCARRRAKLPAACKPRRLHVLCDPYNIYEFPLMSILELPNTRHDSKKTATPVEAVHAEPSPIEDMVETKVRARARPGGAAVACRADHRSRHRS